MPHHGVQAICNASTELDRHVSMAAANHNHKPDLAANTLLNTTEMTPSSIPELKASAVDRSLDYFATMTIHGLANKTNGSPEILRLDRVPTFPGLLARTVPVIPYEWPRSMSAHSLTECHLHLELRIGQLIGSGRVGSVYGVDVVKAISDDISFDTNTFISQLPRLCLKVSTPTHCRGLAREAWVYEQLGAAKLTGTVTARCYGPFNANLQDHDAVVPSWSKEFENWFEKCKDGRDDLQDDWDDGAFFTDDSQSSRSASPWNTWRANKDYPEVTVMLLERLGSTLEENEYESNE